VATLRITTTRDGVGAVGPRAAYLRLGRKTTQWIRSDDSMRISVVDGEGTLSPHGFTQDWKRWTVHPDTGAAFAGQRIPCFAAAVSACVALHRRAPHFGIVGWDVAVDADERVRLLEWNGVHCDIKFSEATTGPCFTGLGWEDLRREPTGD
jgi:hypothetical protein